VSFRIFRLPTTSVVIVALAVLAATAMSCSGNRATPRVDPTLSPQPATLPAVKGYPQPVATVRHASGVTSEFVEGFLLIRPRTADDLPRFIARYGGEVVQDNSVPALPAAFGVTLTDAQRAPTEYLVRIDLSRVDVSRFDRLAARAGWQGTVQFSSDAGLRTFAGALDARDQGFRADANFVFQEQQAFPVAPGGLPLTLLTTNERPNGPGAFTDALTQPLYGAAPNGSPANVTLAWEFVAAHGIQRQVRVAIIDDGYYLTTTGQPLGADSDFAGVPLQIDLVRGTPFADGAGAGVCGGTPCPWHGTGAAGVAVGVLNNNQGAAGTGSVVAVPILVKAGRTRANKNQAIRAAVAAGADVVSMSWGIDCDSVRCREADRDDTPFDDLAGSQNRPVFVASAGNGQGGNGYDVGAPRFYHPCIEDHVICVGALNTGAANATDRIQYSNFGDRVDVFAPTNIPVMSYPNGAGVVGTRTFGGTSASTPYVAGIAAMMKALDPSLGSDQIAALLRQTAIPGTGDAKRVVDALAAVRRVAQPFAMVKDRHEPNSLDNAPKDLGTAASYVENNLNLDPSDRDFFRFGVPGGSVATVRLRYPSRLGAVWVNSLVGAGGACASPAFVSDTPHADGLGRDVVYRLAGGPHVIETRANALIAYNLSMTFTPAAVPQDAYEPNDQVAQAKFQQSRVVQHGPLGVFMETLSPRVTLDATIHTPSDVDFYIVRGVDLMGKTFGLTGTSIIFNTPAVMVYGNDSSVDLQVFRLNADRTAGPLVGRATGADCVAEPLAVTLEQNVMYLVKVSGAPGRYTLQNGITTSDHRLPFKQRDRLYEVLHPGEPIESVVRGPEVYIVPADREFESVISDDPRVHLRLLDAAGRVIAEGFPSGTGERVSFANAGQATTMLEATRRDRLADAPTLRLTWRPAGGRTVVPSQESPNNLR